MRVLSCCLALLVAASLPLQAEAAKKKSNPKPAPEAVAPAPAPAPAPTSTQAPADFADAFHEAMHSRDREKVVAMMAPDLVVFETGYLEATREEYIKSSLDEDVAFASVTEYRPLSRGVIGSGDHMTVLTKASIKGLFAGQTVDLQQSETMILRRAGTSWEIVHLHWSAHPRQPETVQPQAQAAPPTPPELPSAAVPAREVEPQAPASLKESTELTLPAVTEAKPDEAKTP